MTEWRRLSRLPESEEYWQRLTGRMQRSAQAAADEPLERAWSLAPFAWTALAAAAAAIVAVAVRPTAPAEPARTAALLSPTDSTGAAWVERSQPPDAVEVLLAQSGRLP